MLRITKKGTRNFWHFDGFKELDFSEWEITTNVTETEIILIQKNGAPFPKKAVLITDVVVIDETDASIEETFLTWTDLRARLIELGYNPLVSSGGGGGETNLTYESSADNGIINNDNGTGVSIPLVNNIIAGLTSPTMKSDWDGAVSGLTTLLGTGSRLITSTEITKLSNTSGTNSGDNATNTTSNSYADAKVEDTIVNGVTTKAPSQNAVFDALSLKADKTNAFKKIYKISNLATTTSGTAETLITEIPFAANEVEYGDLFSMLVLFTKLTGGSISGTLRIRASQTDLASSTVIATYTSGTTQSEFFMQRETLKLVSGNLLKGFNFTSNIASDLVSHTLSEGSMTIDPTQAWNLYITLQSGNSSATFGLRTAKILVI